MVPQRDLVLRELYRLSRDESAVLLRLQEWESILESARLLAGRFDFETAAPLLVDALDALSQYPSSRARLRLEGQCLVALANIRRDQGRTHGRRGAHELYGRAGMIWRDLGEHGRLAEVTWYLGVCAEMVHRHIEALRYYRTALDMVEPRGYFPALRGRVLLRIGTVLTKVGAFNEAERAIHESLNTLERRVPSADYAWSHQKLAIVRFGRGERDRARYLVQDLLMEIPESEKFRVTQSKILLAQLALAEGDEDEGVRAAADAEQLALAHGFGHQLARLYDTISQYGASAPWVTAPGVWQDPEISAIYRELVDHLTERKLIWLCANIGIDYTQLSEGDNRRKAESLMTRALLANRFDQLVILLRSSPVGIPMHAGIKQHQCKRT